MWGPFPGFRTGHLSSVNRGATGRFVLLVYRSAGLGPGIANRYRLYPSQCLSTSATAAPRSSAGQFSVTEQSQTTTFSSPTFSLPSMSDAICAGEHIYRCPPNSRCFYAVSSTMLCCVMPCLKMPLSTTSLPVYTERSHSQKSKYLSTACFEITQDAKS